MQPMKVESSTSSFTTTIPQISQSKQSTRYLIICILSSLSSFFFVTFLFLLFQKPNSNHNNNDLNNNNKQHNNDEDILTGNEQSLKTYYQGLDVSNAFLLNSNEGIQYLAQKMQKKKQKGSPFVIGALGDLLTGGIGNCVTDGYLQVLERNVKESFVLKGLSLEIRPITFSPNCGTSSITAIQCSTSLIGMDMDLLHYSFQYQSMNETQETRLELANLAKGSVHIVQATCSLEDNILNDKLLRTFGRKGSDLLCLEEGLKKVFVRHPPANNFWGVVGDGMHDTCRNSNSGGILWRNWIPGPLGHQFLADATSMILLKALNMMSETMDDLNEEEENQSSCFSSHLPKYGKDQIQLVEKNHWNLLPGIVSGVDDLPKDTQNDPKCLHRDSCGYLEGRGSAAGELIFSIPASTKPRNVYICCCCNFELCVEEQFYQKSVEFSWKNNLLEENQIVGKQTRGECLLIAKNLMEKNQLSIKLTDETVEVPVRISHVIASSFS